MVKLAILGFGTVGSGVLEVVRTHGPALARRAGTGLEVGYVCDIRDFSARPDAHLFVNNIDPILQDPDVRVVVETIGGLDPAYFYVKSALESGRHVVTSNKELVAERGAELLAVARANGVCFLFEASVGGGTPVIKPMHECLSANVIQGVWGVVNGTTNFMLTEMERRGVGFDAALKTAQALGYAETRDPSADVDGIDAQRKVAILASLMLGRHIYPADVPARGIRDVTPADLAAARKMGRAVKLVARAVCGEDPLHPAVEVAPMLVPRPGPLADVDGVYNAVMMRCDMLGDVCFTGQGAGRLPTASAVAADAADALRQGTAVHDTLWWAEALPLPAGGSWAGQDAADWYVRLAGGPAPAGAQALGDGAFLVRNQTEQDLRRALAGCTVANWMRLLTE